MTTKVVVHLLDGSLVKGTSLDLNPDRAECHVHTPDGRARPVRLADVKAVFVVRDHAGDPARADAQAPDPADLRSRGTRQVEIRFRDGERLVALAPTHHPTRPYFFVLPVDPQSNNIRILVNRAATASVSLL